ncbi:MAG: hypothetical protein JSW39_13770, partial [Desulfobacterales bacterium]
ISAIILGAFIARAPDPERMLPVYYLALGLANPVAYAATRLQAVVLAFPPQPPDDGRTLYFALRAGAVLGILPLFFILPGLVDLYYVKLQKLDPQDLALIRITATALILYPLSVAIRAESEGRAAWQKKPSSVLSGQALFMITILAVGYCGLGVGLPGYLIGPIGLTLGSLASSGTIRLSLNWEKNKMLPTPPTTTSVGQIR